MVKTFFNIFSKPKTRISTTQSKNKQSNSKIIIDYREKNSLVISELKRQGFEIEFKELKVADYIIRNVVIERKTISDFISSMINKRLIKQLEELKQYNNPLLIIEGIEEQELYNDDNHMHVNPNAIRGFLLSILLKHKIPIMFTKNAFDTAKFIEIISKKKAREMSLNVNKKNLTKKERLQFILEGFPGIGPKTSRKLLTKFKTIKNIINASEQELKEILGKKAESVINFIEGVY